MQIFLDNRQVIKLWKIRINLIKNLQDAKFLSQSFFTLVLISFVPWFISGFDSLLKSKYIIITVTMSTTILLIFAFLFYIKKNAKLKKQGKISEVLLILIYNIMSLGWSSWIFAEMGNNHLKSVSYLSESIQTDIKLIILGITLVTAVATLLFSTPILQWHIQQRDESKKNQKFSPYINRMIGIGAGIGLLLFNFSVNTYEVDLTIVVVYFLGTLVISGLVFTAVTNIVELFYYLRHISILNTQSYGDT